jgi:hypothetical protein
MAVTYPHPHPTAIEDPVTYEEASALFDRTGHPAHVNTLRRYVKEDGIATERRGRAVCVSWTALLVAHRRRTAAKLRCSSNWP